MDIRLDDLRGEAIQELLKEHLDHMYSTSPACSVHALDLDGLRHPDVSVWSVWDAGELAGCGALKELDSQHGEIKSMRTAKAFLRQGVAALMLQFVIEESLRRNYQQLSLETGTQKDFHAARQLYVKFGFEECAPFADYRLDPNSVYMGLNLCARKES